MKFLVTGAKGQLGTDLVRLLEEKGYEVFGYGKEELDITRYEEVNNLLNEIQPEVVLHTAAYTNVDLAESNPDSAFLINSIGTRNIAVCTEKIGAKLVYISTDYVFNGSLTEPLNEFSPTCPLGVYGKSKLAGEQFVRDFSTRHFIVRTSWVFGKNGNNFVKTMLKLAETKSQLKVVQDQVGSPTYTLDLAYILIDLIHTEYYGVYHVTNSGQCSWYEFAKAIFEEAKIEVELKPCTTQEFPRPAPRPAYSVLGSMSLRLNGFKEVRHWRDALKEFLFSEEIKLSNIKGKRR